MLARATMSSSQYIQPDIESQPNAHASSSSSSSNPQAAATALGSMPTSNSSTSEPSIWSQSSHPVALLFLFLFRSLAIATYLLCGFFAGGYVFSTVLVVLLLSADFWTVRNVSGRVLVGLRFWNEVSEDGNSYWVFESRDPSQPGNAVDSKCAHTHALSVTL